MMRKQTHEKILLIQLGDMGDVVFCTPLIKALKMARPNAWLTFLTESSIASLLSTNPYLDEILVWERSQYRQWAYVISRLAQIRKKKFDLVIDLQGSPRTALCAWLSDAKSRLGFNYRLRSRLYTGVVTRSNSSKYGVSFKMDLLKPLEIADQDVRPCVWTTTSHKEWRERMLRNAGIDARRPVIAISAVSRRIYKRWPLEHFSQLCDSLQDKYQVQVILLWGPGERGFAERVAQMAQAETIISDETPSLLHLAALLEGCHLLVGNDNGVKHIATAVGIPTFTIYGHSDPVSWTYPDPTRHGYIRSTCACGMDCKDESVVAPCLMNLSAQDVMKQLGPFLRQVLSTHCDGKVEPV